MATLDVPGIGTVKIAGDVPTEIEEQRIRGELARRGFGKADPDAIAELERRTGQKFNVSPAPTDIPAEAVPSQGAPPTGVQEEPGLAPEEVDRNMPNMSPGKPTARTKIGPLGELIVGKQPDKSPEEKKAQLAEFASETDPIRRRDIAQRYDLTPEDQASLAAPGTREVPGVMDVVGKTLGLGASAVGAMQGAKLGSEALSGLGPVGRTIGAIGGAAIGYATVDTTVKAAEDFVKSGKLPTPGKTLERYGDAIRDDLIGQGVVAGAVGAVRGVGSLALKTLSSLLGTASPSVREAIQQGKRVGVDIGAVDMNSAFGRGVAKTLLVIPVVATPVRREATVKTAQVAKSAEGLLDDIAPAVDMARLSTRMERGAEHFWRQRRNTYEGMKTGLVARVEEAGNPAMVSGDAIRGRMLEFLERFKSNAVDLPKHMQPGTTGFTGSQALDDYILKLFPPERQWMTVKEANAAIRDIRVMFQRHGTQSGVMSEQNAAISYGLDNAWKQGLADSFTAFREGMSNLIRNPTAAQVNADTYKHYLGIRQQIMNTGKYPTPNDVVKLAGELDHASAALRQEWANIKSLEMSVAGKMISRIDKNFFRAGMDKPGSVEFDSIAQSVLSNPHLMRSPQFISDLASLVGKDNVRLLARAHISKSLFPRADEAQMLRSLQGVPGTEGTLARRQMLAPPSAGAETIPLMDAKNAKEALGLARTADIGNQRGSQAALAKLLEGTGVTPGKLRDLVEVAERVQASPLGDTSAFLARRVVLGGQASLPRFGAKEIAGGVAGSVMFATVLPGFAARSVGNLLSTPRGLRLLTEGMKDFERTRDAANFIRRIGPALDPDDRVAQVDNGDGTTKQVTLKELDRIIREADKEADKIILDLERRSQ